MGRLIFWRLAQLPFLLLVIYTGTFVLAWVVPGDPKDTEGRKRPKVIQEALEARYSLDDPVKFYYEYVIGKPQAEGGWKGGLIRGEFGESMAYPDFTVNQIVADALPVSVLLGVLALLIALLIGTFAGVIGAIRQGGALDTLTLGIALLGISLPTFVTGTVLLIAFALWWPLLPVGGWGSWQQMILPAFTLSLPFAAYIARLTRMGMLDVMSSDFIRTARAKGQSERVVMMRHALKVAFLPVVSYMGPASAAAMTGSFVIEKVFNIPGMGQHFVEGVLNKDITLIIGVVLVYATLLILFNLLVDIAYSFVDPRIDLDAT